MDARQQQAPRLDGSPRRVVLSGYYGHGNFGDEAMLERLVDLLGRAPDAEIVVTSGSPARTARRHRVAAVSQHGLRERFRALRGADLLVVGGGELVKNPPSDGDGVGTALALLDVALASVLGMPSVVFQVGAEEIRDARARRYVRDILSLSEVVFARDAETVARLADAGVPRERLRLGADVLFGASPAPPARRDGLGPIVAITLPDAELRYAALEQGERFRRFLGGLVDAICAVFAPLGGRALLLGFQDTERASDARLLRHVERALSPGLRTEVITVSDRPLAEMLDLVGGVDFVVGMRLHSIVLAALQRVPFLALSWEDKVAKLARELDVRDWCFDLRADAPDAIGGRLRRAWSSRDDLRARIERGLPALVERAREGERYLLRETTGLPRRRAVLTRGRAALLLGRIALDYATRRWRRGGGYVARHTHYAWSEEGAVGTLVRIEPPARTGARK